MKAATDSGWRGHLVALLIPMALVACTAGGGSGGKETGDGDGDSVSEEEEFLSTCEGHECPGGTREGVRAVCGDSKVGPRLLRRLTRIELENSLRDIFPEVGAEWGGVELSQDPVSSLGFSTDAKVLVVNGPTFKNMLETAEELADLVTAPDTLSTLLPCASSGDVACATEFIQRYGMRLFRRPLSDDELNRYLDYQQSVAGRSDFAGGIKWVLSVMMQSPRAFYRSEIGMPAAAGHELTQYELATNLAFTYAGTTPSEELLAMAEAGQLTSPEQRMAVAEALLADGSNWEASREFFRQWLGYRQILNQSRDADPTFAEEVSPLLVVETELFLDQILFNRGTAQSMMTANFTALNDRLSSFYGFGAAPTPEFVAVERPADRGLGILAQGSLLAATSHQAETSPTLRGLLYTEKFLCMEPPPPPDIVPPLSEAPGIDEAKTTREKYELFHGTGGCANCHQAFDPFGYAFEHFDETGRYRDDEDGEPIDTAAVVTLPDDTQRAIETLGDLSRVVNDTDHVENCISGLMATYFLSGGGGANCLAEESRGRLAAGEITLKEYLVSLAGAPHFSTRGL